MAPPTKRAKGKGAASAASVVSNSTASVNVPSALPDENSILVVGTVGSGGGSIPILLPPSMTAKLVLQANAGGEGGTPGVIPLHGAEGQEITLGRSADSEIVLSSLQISRRHCKFERKTDAKRNGDFVWYITDTSTNGISVLTPSPPSTSSVPGPALPVPVRLEKGVATPLQRNSLLYLVSTGTIVYKFEQPHEASITISDSASEASVEELLDIDDDDHVIIDVPSPLPNSPDEEESLLDLDLDSFKDCVEQLEESLHRKRQLNPSEDDASTSVPSAVKKAKPSAAETEESSESLKKTVAKLQAQLNLYEVEKLYLQNELKDEKVKTKEESERTRDGFCKQLLDVLESEFSCCVCSGIFVEPQTSPSCGHTFCAYCITEWLKKKAECPICRCHIAPHNRPKKHVEMGNFIDKVFYCILPEDQRRRREVQVFERKEEMEAAAVRAHAQNNPRVAAAAANAAVGAVAGGGGLLGLQIPNMNYLINQIMGGLGPLTGAAAAAAAGAVGMGGGRGGNANGANVQLVDLDADQGQGLPLPPPHVPGRRAPARRTRAQPGRPRGRPPANAPPPSGSGGLPGGGPMNNYPGSFFGGPPPSANMSPYLLQAYGHGPGPGVVYNTPMSAAAAAGYADAESSFLRSVVRRRQRGQTTNANNQPRGNNNQLDLSVFFVD